MRHRRLFVVIGRIASLLVAASPAVQAADGRGSFIIVLKDSVDAPRGVAAEHSAVFGADVTHVYSHALKGYSARMDEAQLGALRADKRVAYVLRRRAPARRRPGRLGRTGLWMRHRFGQSVPPTRDWPHGPGSLTMWYVHYAIDSEVTHG